MKGSWGNINWSELRNWKKLKQHLKAKFMFTQKQYKEGSAKSEVETEGKGNVYKK